MKKVVGFVVVLLLAALLIGGYYETGVLTESNLKKNIEVLNKSDEVKVSVAKYQRGWFKSNAILNWTISIPSKVIERNGKRIFKPSQVYHAEMPLVIQHGPIILQNQQVRFGIGAASSHLDLPNEYARKFDELYTDTSIQPSLNLDFFVSYNNIASIKLVAPKFHLVSTKDNTDFEWFGMTTNVAVSPNLKEIKGEVLIDGVKLVQDKTSSMLKNVESEYELYKSDSGLYLGDASLHLPTALVTENGNKLIEISELNFKSKSSINDNLFSSSFKATLNKLLFNDETYRSCSFDLSIRNLDAKVLVDINKKISKSQDKSDSARQRVLLSLLPDIPILVNKGAEIDLSNVTVEMTDGRVSGNAIIRIPKENTPNPFKLARSLTGDGRVEISSGLLQSMLKHMYKNKYNADRLKNIAKRASEPQDKFTETDKNKVAEPTVVSHVEGEPATLTEAELEAQITAQADSKISHLVKLGVLAMEGDNYALNIKILQGRLLINEHPFNPSMMQL
ncbi:MAG: DUF945 family protein [Legionellaceae bacterium]|nr:DUF945 family protein [Legionellaceae bacterium]